MAGKSNREEQHLPEEKSEGALGKGIRHKASLASTSSPAHRSSKRLCRTEQVSWISDPAGEVRFLGTCRDNDIRAVTSLPHLQSEEGGPEPQLSESRALSKETPARSAPPTMGCGPVCCVALCLLAAGGALAQGGTRVPSLTLPESKASSGSLPRSFSAPVFFPHRPCGFWSHPNPKIPD